MTEPRCVECGGPLNRGGECFNCTYGLRSGYTGGQDPMTKRFTSDLRNRRSQVRILSGALAQDRLRVRLPAVPSLGKAVLGLLSSFGFSVRPLPDGHSTLDLGYIFGYIERTSK